MNGGARILKLGWRMLVTILLLGWIFHAIFVNEGKVVAEGRGVEWGRLSRAEQWHYGWWHGPPALWQTLTSVHPGALAGSFGLMGITVLLGVVRWRMVLEVQGLHLSLGRATEISFVAHFFNSFLLGSTGGDLMKAYYAARETHHKKMETVVTVFVDRIVGLWAMLLFATVMMIPNYHLLFEHKRMQALASLILAMTAGGTAFLVVAFWGGVSKAWSGARIWLRKLPKGDHIERSVDSCRQFGRNLAFLPRVLGLSMLLNLVCVAQFWVLCQGLNLSVSPVVLLCAVPSIICIAALPITPSGLGVRENLFVLVLAEPSINVAATSALSLSLLAYAGSLFWSLVGGVVYLLFKEKHHLTEVRLDPGADPGPQG